MDSIFCVGIDLCDDYSQVSYSNGNMAEPETLDFTGLEYQYRIPTMISKTIGRDEWFAGDEALKSSKLGEAKNVGSLYKIAMDKNPLNIDDTTIMPIELIMKYLDYLISAAKDAGKSEKVDKISIAFEEYNISMLNVVAKALELLGYDRKSYSFISHDEAFVYYALSQKNDLWRNDVFLFDYEKRGLTVKRLYVANQFGNKLALVNNIDFAEEIPYELSRNTLSEEFLDTKLLQVATSSFEKKNISTVYLTGMGFEGDKNLPSFIKCICDKKRAFVGANLYCRGACYSALEAAGKPYLRDIMLACSQRITTGIEMKISDRGRDKILRLVKPGANWYFADCRYDFIVDEATELELFLSPLDTSEKQVVRVSLTDFLDRPKKATRISVTFSFTSDSRCHMMVKDMGFGEFFASSGRIINEEILL